MPKRDGTGPMGQGTMTGRGLGNCNDGEIMNSGFGMGRRFGRGMGCSNGRGYNREYLTEQKSMLQKTLDSIEKQLENLK